MNSRIETELFNHKSKRHRRDGNQNEQANDLQPTEAVLEAVIPIMFVTFRYKRVVCVTLKAVLRVNTFYTI